VVNEITVIGSRCGRFQPALDLLRRRRVDVAPLLAQAFPLAEGVKALKTAAKPGMLKVLLRP
jgi:threonine dehydrogenase-like Zn-dependent dehydrogenase